MKQLLVMLVLGCATSPPTPAARTSDAVFDEWIERHERRPAPTVRAAAAEHRARTRNRGPSSESVGSGRRIDVAFRGAPLTEALRLLADEAHVQLVIADDLAGEVNLRLRAVRPYDAMLALAEAHGADVLRDGDLVIVRSR